MNFLIASWIDSILIVKPQRALQLGYFVVRSLCALCITLVRTFWWFLLASFFILVLKPHWLVFMALVVLWLLIVIVAVRPSVKRKNSAYFLENIPFGVPLFFLFLVPCCVPFIFLCCVAPWLVMTMFFVCDSGGFLHSLLKAPFRAAKMAFYKFPLYLVLIALFYCCYFFSLIFSVVCIVPCIITVILCLYTMWLHTNYGDYCESAC